MARNFIADSWLFEPAYSNKILPILPARNRGHHRCQAAGGEPAACTVLPFEYGVPELVKRQEFGVSLRALENVKPAGIPITQHDP